MVPYSRDPRSLQNNQTKNWPANRASPPPKTMPEICRFAPPSPNMNISPPMTIATSASDRASGPVKVVAKLLAARSQGDCASAIVGTRTAATTMMLARRITERVESPDMQPPAGDVRARVTIVFSRYKHTHGINKTRIRQQHDLNGRAG